ncbi:hypothetical protein NPIL_482561 [Nephila pilipes]|uniref:Uncharacterized protein n=1 Tax=Nephila pilipes TaxID=299642 RepID=A0A8X6T714_NEPPI|nr:hypothetical protein NPIL_482561 [Nephila pilipes]
MSYRMYEDEGFLVRVCSSDESTLLHVSGKLNCHKVRIWGLETPRETLEIERDRPKKPHVVHTHLGRKNCVIMSRYRAPVTFTASPASLSKKYSPKMSSTRNPHQTVTF